MAYKLIITEKAEELLDNLIYHLIYRLKSTQAAVHLFDSIDKIYDRLEENPFQFPESRDMNLRSRGYREAVLNDMDYVIIFRIEETFVYVAGFISWRTIERKCDSLKTRIISLKRTEKQ